MKCDGSVCVIGVVILLYGFCLFFFVFFCIYLLESYFVVVFSLLVSVR